MIPHHINYFLKLHFWLISKTSIVAYSINARPSPIDKEVFGLHITAEKIKEAAEALESTELKSFMFQEPTAGPLTRRRRSSRSTGRSRRSTRGTRRSTRGTRRSTRRSRRSTRRSRRSTRRSRRSTRRSRRSTRRSRRSTRRSRRSTRRS